MNLRSYLADRDFQANETILSGDIGIPDDNSDNSYNVVRGANNATLDGFTITAGNADGSSWGHRNGAGMYNSSSSLTVTNCTFASNTADNRGGGMFNGAANLTVTNSTFIGNSATFGGGIMNWYGSSTVTNSSFIDNSASWTGGGLYNFYSDATVTNCTFSGNSADYAGGLMNTENIQIVTGCTFSGNTARYGGGLYNNRSNSTIVNCTFSENLAVRHGGGMYNNNNSDLKITNCTFAHNRVNEDGGGMYNVDVSGPVVTNCTFRANSAYRGGGLYNRDSVPIMANCILWANTAELGPQIENRASTLTLTYSCIQGGWSGEGNINVNPLLASLADNGGPTLTHAIAAHSPAYSIPEYAGAGNWNGAPDTDQRGVDRATVGYRAMGAFEEEASETYTLMVTASGASEIEIASTTYHGGITDYEMPFLRKGTEVRLDLEQANPVRFFAWL